MQRTNGFRQQALLCSNLPGKSVWSIDAEGMACNARSAGLVPVNSSPGVHEIIKQTFKCIQNQWAVPMHHSATKLQDTTHIINHKTFLFAVVKYLLGRISFAASYPSAQCALIDSMLHPCCWPN
jgi:hypothetical protein